MIGHLGDQASTCQAFAAAVDFFRVAPALPGDELGFECNGNSMRYRERIRRDQREKDIARLRTMVEEGLASGPASADTDEDWADSEAIARNAKA